MNRQHHPVSIEQASQDSPILSQLAALTRESSARLESIGFLIPVPLRPAIKPGPIDNDNWCLLAANSGAAAKLRQLVPKILEHLVTQGASVKSIRVRTLSEP